MAEDYHPNMARKTSKKAKKRTTLAKISYAPGVIYDDTGDMDFDLVFTFEHAPDHPVPRPGRTNSGKSSRTDNTEKTRTIFDDESEDDFSHFQLEAKDQAEAEDPPVIQVPCGHGLLPGFDYHSGWYRGYEKCKCSECAFVAKEKEIVDAVIAAELDMEAEIEDKILAGIEDEPKLGFWDIFLRFLKAILR
ncbi:hypothetical protein BDV18DRAFT_161469 [Aspergillus unguis]